MTVHTIPPEWAELVRKAALYDEMLDALETIAMGNTDPDRMVEIAYAVYAKAKGGTTWFSPPERSS